MPPTKPCLRLCAFFFAALLASCGGGDSGNVTPLPPPPVVAVTVQITAPGALDNVFTAGTPVAVRASAAVNGVAVADGTVVRFSTPSGTFSPVAPGSRTGVASTTLTSSATGPLQINATVAETDRAGTATQTIYQRPTPARVEILVPAYFYPSTGSAWNTLTTSAAANPLVTIVAIMNPNNGIFTSADANFTRATTQFVAAGGKVLGYVYTGYGKGGRSIADIKLNIDRYLQLYGRERISGFFLDEMASETQRLDFYREIYSYIKSIDPSLRVVGNPGMVPAAQYASVADTLVVFESTASDYQKFDPRPQNVWLYSYANQTQAMLAHNTASCAAMQTAMQAAATARNNAGLVYATDREYNAATGVGNPWSALPAYWENMVRSVDAINRGATLPRC
ncbi:MAG: spherulation-specific family 4 protein [Rhodoferax sp.]